MYSYEGILDLTFSIEHHIKRAFEAYLRREGLTAGEAIQPLILALLDRARIDVEKYKRDSN